MASPQSLVQSNIQNAVGTQSMAQNSVPFLSNNGNPFTVYNQMPGAGGYVPPTMDASGNWMINPLPAVNPFWLQPQPTAPTWQLPPLPPANGVTPPTSPPVAPPITNPPGMSGPTPPIMSDPLPPTASNGGGGAYEYPVGGGAWMGGGTGIFGSGGGSLNTSYTDPYFGTNAYSSSGLGSNLALGVGATSNPFSGWGNGGNSFGQLLDMITEPLFPGNHYTEGGGMNWRSVGAGAVDSLTGGLLGAAQLVPGVGDKINAWIAGGGAGPGGNTLNWGTQAMGNKVGFELGQINPITGKLNIGTGLTTSPINKQSAAKSDDYGPFNPGYTPTSAGAQFTPASTRTPGEAVGHGGITGDSARAMFEAMAMAERMRPTFQRHNQVF